MPQLITRFLILSLFVFLSGCAAMQPKLKNPTVELVNLRTLPAHGLQQRIAVELMITNPNSQELTIRSINYIIGIEDINVLTGATNQFPALKPLEKTPVTLEVSADILQALRLIEHFSHNGIGEKVNYNFTADIDFSAWLPTMHVDRKGMIPLNNKNKDQQNK